MKNKMDITDILFFAIVIALLVTFSLYYFGERLPLLNKICESVGAERFGHGAEEGVICVKEVMYCEPGTNNCIETKTEEIVVSSDDVSFFEKYGRLPTELKKK